MEYLVCDKKIRNPPSSHFDEEFIEVGCKVGYFITKSIFRKVDNHLPHSLTPYCEIAKSCKMSNNFIKVIAFCLSQAIVIRGFRFMSRPLLTAVKTSLKMGIPEYSMPDQQARFAKAKAEGMSTRTLFVQ